MWKVDHVAYWYIILVILAFFSSSQWYLLNKITLGHYENQPTKFNLKPFEAYETENAMVLLFEKQTLN